MLSSESSEEGSSITMEFPSSSVGVETGILPINSVHANNVAVEVNSF